MLNNDKAMDLAKEALEGKKLKAAGFCIVYFIIFILLQIVLEDSKENISTADIIISTLRSIIITVPLDFLAIGFCNYFYNLFKYKNESVKDLLCGFKMFKRNAIISILTTSFVTISFTILIVAFSILSRSQQPLDENLGKFFLSFIAILALVILFCYKFMPTLYALTYRMGTDKTEGIFKMLKNTYCKVSKHNYEYLCLQVKFIGWFMLTPITLGLSLLWVMPYYITTMAILTDSIFFPDEYQTDILGEAIFVGDVPPESQTTGQERREATEE